MKSLNTVVYSTALAGSFEKQPPKHIMGNKCPIEYCILFSKGVE